MKIEFIGVVNLFLDFGFSFVLENATFESTTRQNLI